MMESFAHQWDPGHRLACRRTRGRVYCRLSRGLLALLVAAFLTIGAGLLETTLPALAAEPGPADAQPVPQGPLNFEDCVRLAIQRSPYLTKSAMEIDVRRIDETDSRYSVFPPPITFRTYYYVDRPQQPPGFNPKPYSLNFTTEPYNPFGTYFTLQAQKVVTQMAIFAHLQLVNQGLERLGKMFLQLAATKRLTILQGDLINLCRENLTYAENRRSIGTGTSLEVQVATQELDLAKNESERLTTAQKRTLNSLKIFLGFKPEQQVDFDLRDARRQVLGSFDSAAATLEQAKARSYELKLLELKKEMQGYNIIAAKARILPSLLFNAATPDPLSLTAGRGFYVGVGLEVPVWDGFKRIRNVSRQKTILKQIGADKDLKELDLTDNWNDVQGALSGSAAGMKAAKSQEELTRLKERQAEIRYNSGGEPLPVWLEARKGNLEAQKGSATKALEYDQYILNLRQLSGDLGYSYVDQKSWQK